MTLAETKEEIVAGVELSVASLRDQVEAFISAPQEQHPYLTEEIVSTAILLDTTLMILQVLNEID